MDENPVEAGQFLGDDGAFQDGWRDLAFTGDENAELRTDPTLANIKDVRSMAKMVVNSQKTIGKMSGGRDFAILPNEQSTDDERNEFHIKCGRPASAEEYEFGKLPEGTPKDEKFIAKMGQVCLDAGISKTAGAKLMSGYMEYYADLAKAMETEDKLGNAEANKQLHTILGSGYDKTMAAANVAIEAIARPIDNDFAETLKKEMPYDVHAAQFLAKIGSMISEDPGLKGTPSETGFTPADAMTKINEIMKDPYYVTDTPKDKPRNKEYHDQLIEQVKRLFEVKTEQS